MTNEEAILYMTLYRQKLLGSVSDLDKDIEAYDMAIEALQEQKEGHWIDDNENHGTCCSECGKWYSHKEITKREVKWCSECGARMKGGADD